MKQPRHILGMHKTWIHSPGNIFHFEFECNTIISILYLSCSENQCRLVCQKRIWCLVYLRFSHLQNISHTFIC